MHQSRWFGRFLELRGQLVEILRNADSADWYTAKISFGPSYETTTSGTLPDCNWFRSSTTPCVETKPDSPKFMTQTGWVFSFASRVCNSAGIVCQSGDPVPHIVDAPKANTLYD